MVVLAAAVLSKSGKILVSRQFLDMPRDKLEGYVREFMHSAKPCQEGTSFEGADVGYVYQTTRSLYVLIITNKHSNIIEDMDTLKLLHRLVSEKSTSLGEKGVSNSAFENIFAFDEVIDPMGYKEDVDFQQVMTNLDMSSDNELSHIIKTRMKVSKANEVMKQKAIEIENKKFMNTLTGLSSTRRDARIPSAISTTMPFLTRPLSITQAEEPSISSSSEPIPSLKLSPNESSGVPSKSVRASDKGLRLQSDKGKQNSKIVEAIKTEIGYLKDEQSNTTLPPSDLVVFSVLENISVTRYTSDDTVGFDLNGSLSLQIPVHLGALNQVQIEAEENIGILYEPAPDINKKLFSDQRILSLQDQYLISHVSPDYALNILYWNTINCDKSLLPLLVDCLQTSTVLYIQYKASPMSNLRNVMITVLYPNLTKVVSGINNNPGTSWYDYKESAVKWSIPLIEESDNMTGTLEIHHQQEDALPISSVSVDFITESSLSKLKVVNMVPMRPGDPVTFTQRSVLSTKKYVVKP